MKCVVLDPYNIQEECRRKDNLRLLNQKINKEMQTTAQTRYANRIIKEDF